MKLHHILKEKLISVNDPISEKPHLRLAAVLIPVFINDNKILFTKRTENLKQHQGQIAFPGGRYDESDENLAETALRETQEEVGIEKQFIQLLGRLKPKISTSNHYVYPYVGSIQGTPPIQINPSEVKEYFFADLDLLLDSKTLETGFYKGETRKYYHIYNYKIWGLTQIILTDFLTLIRDN